MGKVTTRLRRRTPAQRIEAQTFLPAKLKDAEGIQQNMPVSEEWRSAIDEGRVSAHLSGFLGGNRAGAGSCNGQSDLP